MHVYGYIIKVRVPYITLAATLLLCLAAGEHEGRLSACVCLVSLPMALRCLLYSLYWAVR